MKTPAIHACRHLVRLAFPIATAVLLATPGHAAITVPGANGSDGPLTPTGNLHIDLSLAPTGTWDADNSANAGQGIYDPTKWAVVFKYSEVNIPTGTTVTFTNHPSRAPVVWLVSGNVTIDGTLSLNGQNGQGTPNLAEPGPGGFRGGVYIYSTSVRGGAGFGPGGGAIGSGGSGGGHSTQGAPSSTTYGNPSLIPLIGGSGGGGKNAGSTALGGGAGGGAILIATTGTCTLNGEVRANGGTGSNDTYTVANRSGGGSGGGIRIIADTLAGNGRCTANGGDGNHYGGAGRIRMERINNPATVTVSPAPSMVSLPLNATALLWPPENAPDVRIVSIGAVNAPTDPRAAFGTQGADVTLPLVSQTEVVVETVNVEQASQVKVRITPRDNTSYTEVDAAYSATVNTDPLTIRWTATVPSTMGYSAIQARAIRP